MDIKEKIGEFLNEGQAFRINWKAAPQVLAKQLIDRYGHDGALLKLKQKRSSTPLFERGNIKNLTNAIKLVSSAGKEELAKMRELHK